MAEKNLETYLSEQDMEYQKKSAKIEKRKNRFKKKIYDFRNNFCSAYSWYDWTQCYYKKFNLQ